jgi:hypothetical protein
MDEEIQVVDMENNPDPAAEVRGVAAAAQPDRHGFWAWRERVMRRNHNNNPDDGLIVAAAEPSQRGRVLFFFFALFLDIVVFTVSALLLMLCDGYKPMTMVGRALQVAGRVAGISCIVVGSVGYFFIGVFIAEALPVNPEHPRTIDFFI